MKIFVEFFQLDPNQQKINVKVEMSIPEHLLSVIFPNKLLKPNSVIPIKEINKKFQKDWIQYWIFNPSHRINNKNPDPEKVLLDYSHTMKSYCFYFINN